MSADPYASPAVHVQTANVGTGLMLTEGVVREMIGTRPWVRFMSVLMFLGTGLMLLMSVSMLLLGSLGKLASKGATQSVDMVVIIAGFYAIFGIIYIFPAIKLWKYASCISDMQFSGGMVDLEKALREQRIFWKFAGIMVIACVLLYLAVILGFIFFGVFPAVVPRGGI